MDTKTHELRHTETPGHRHRDTHSQKDMDREGHRHLDTDRYRLSGQRGT